MYKNTDSKKKGRWKKGIRCKKWILSNPAGYGNATVLTVCRNVSNGKSTILQNPLLKTLKKVSPSAGVPEVGWAISGTKVNWKQCLVKSDFKKLTRYILLI